MVRRSGSRRGGGSQPADQSDQPAAAGPHHAQTPRATAGEVERRIAEAQLWIAQRLPLVEIRAKAGESWGVNNIKTINRYLDLARERMVEELIYRPPPPPSRTDLCPQ
jgi:hypothetical protein